MTRKHWLIIIFGIFLGLAMAIASYFLYCPNQILVLDPSSKSNSKNRVVYFVQHDWHSGLAWQQQQGEKFGAEAWKDAPYVEVGWGDRQFYYANDQSILSMLRAVFIPSDSVIHVASLAVSPAQFFQVPVLPMTLSEVGFQNLFNYVKNTFAVDGNGDRLAAIGQGQYVISNFYAAVPRYFGLFNCNTWAAEALRQAGVAVCPNRALMAKDLGKQLIK
ncbi:DUF2459 domain-containing protein [Pseudanabaena mucicola]|uniref:DUF2459 domain-containing protein n=1 Tax=Pseudanabaena mucicola FACHB-723 TaxID=2692860 RepID=A0ABR7ZU43_9CYAN|nr:DUF2459 domain-containing protein [Pseudanabaena mucicola]MBD2187508.1 DUF2459 domain-containing protein [Pseudanabaena mucicola FACHB-723]